MGTKAASLDALELPGTAEKGSARPSAPARAKRNKQSKAKSKTTTARQTATKGNLTALTVKVDADLYRALQLHKIETRQSHQDILVEALRKYLNT